MIEKESLEKIKEELSRNNEIKEHANWWYDYFQNNFSKDYLKNQIPSEELLIHMFGNNIQSNNMSLTYILEFNTGARGFGSIKGTYAYNYPIRYSNDNWIISNCNSDSQKVVSLNVAIIELDTVINEFIDIFNKVEELIPFNSVNDYIELDNYIKTNHRRFYNKMWFLKYLHMLYPFYFANFYNNRTEDDWLLMLVRELGIKKVFNSKIVLNGQIVLYSRDYYVYPYFFSKMIYLWSKKNKKVKDNSFIDSEKLKSLIDNMSSWQKDIFSIIDSSMDNEFSLDDMYQHIDELSKKHPNNNNVDAAIRQNLQILRDMGIIEFANLGKYKKTYLNE